MRNRTDSRVGFKESSPKVDLAMLQGNRMTKTLKNRRSKRTITDYLGLMMTSTQLSTETIPLLLSLISRQASTSTNLGWTRQRLSSTLQCKGSLKTQSEGKSCNREHSCSVLRGNLKNLDNSLRSTRSLKRCWKRKRLPP